MERNYMRPDALVELDFITDQTTKIHYHENFELLFIISGQLSLTVEEDNSQLSSGDLALINANHKHSYQGSDELVLGRFVISYNKVRELLGMNHVLFWCNSTSDRNEAYDALRRIIAKIFNESLNNDGRNKLYLSSLYYQMLYILAENFTLAPNNRHQKEKKENSDDRIEKIFSYIRNNYQKNITLEDISHHLYLSTTYVSKYIKQKCGINFVALLNSVRLSHAMEDMMYSEESIMKIALENGFASVAAFNKLFKETYHQTPSEFRKQHKNRSDSYREKKEKNQALIQEKVEQYLEQNPNQREESLKEFQLHAQIGLNDPIETQWDRCTCWMINVGTAVDLLNANIQQQILENQECMGFKYIRFWDIYSPELYLDIHSPDGKQNFSRLNAITDFLVEHQLKPYIELGFKGRRIIRTMQKFVHVDQRSDFFENEQEMKCFYQSLFSHFIRRYGSWEVSQWYFEYWEKPEQTANDHIALCYDGMDDSQHKNYFAQFNIIAGALREQLPKTKIGGAGFPVRIYGEDNFTRLLKLWSLEKEQPDFLSISCYPYMQEKKNNTYYEKRFSDLSFVRYGIEAADMAMKAAGFPKIPIHVSEYSLSLSSRNALNDSCLKGAYLLSNTIDCMGKAELLGHFFYTDAFAESSDTDNILFGGNGFFTKDGIPKPSYYAIDFLNQLYPDVQKKHANYLITRNDRGSLRLVCHNLKKPNYNYYLAEEDTIDIRDIPGLLNDREYLKIHLQVEGAKDGNYIVKTNMLNSHHGSIQDKWIDMNMESELTRKEMHYLRMSSISDISIKEVPCKDGYLELDMELEPNEIRYVHIYRK